MLLYCNLEELIPQGQGGSRSHKASQTHTNTYVACTHKGTYTQHRGQTLLNKLWGTKANGDKARPPSISAVQEM